MTITYKESFRDPETGQWVIDNCTDVVAFVGEQEPCSICGDHGEYEKEDGPHGCAPCNSRLIAFKDFTGKRVYADWGDTIERLPDGLHLIPQESV